MEISSEYIVDRDNVLCHILFVCVLIHMPELCPFKILFYWESSRKTDQKRNQFQIVINLIKRQSISLYN